MVADLTVSQTDWWEHVFAFWCVGSYLLWRPQGILAWWCLYQHSGGFVSSLLTSTCLPWLPPQVLYCIKRTNGFNLESAHHMIRVVKFQSLLKWHWPEYRLSHLSKPLGRNLMFVVTTFPPFHFCLFSQSYCSGSCFALRQRSSPLSLAKFGVQLVFLRYPDLCCLCWWRVGGLSHYLIELKQLLVVQNKQ